MKELVIIGAGGFGREILAWARDCSGLWRLKGFLDDNPAASKDPRLRVPVIGTVSDYQPCETDVFLCGVGVPELRRILSEKLRSRGAQFATLIHPTAVVAAGAEVGLGVIVCPFSVISVDVQIGEGTAIYYHSSVDHDAVIGPWTQVSAHCDITGGASVGAEVFIGSHASILPRVKVGDRAVIGAGAIVTGDVPDNMTVVGVPARPHGSNKLAGL
jgi:sugar O-acyltransferase (sialic acid O-acetyltransferase NeuD family)